MSPLPDPPIFTTLIKLMRMTTSSHDNEALAAIRAANRILEDKLDSDWEDLLRGRVRIEVDPFLAAPVIQQNQPTRPPPAPPPRPAPPPPQWQAPSPPPPPQRAPIRSRKERKEIDGFFMILKFASLKPLEKQFVDRLEVDWKTSHAMYDSDLRCIRNLARMAVNLAGVVI